MATESVYLQGKAKWVRVSTPDMYGKYAMVLYPNEESLAKIKKLKEIQTINGRQYEGLKNKLRRDEDGDSMAFGCHAEKIIKGVRRLYAAPMILDKDNLPIHVNVGNGSEVTIKIETYSYQPPGSKIGGTAARLVSIRVDKLVPYEANSNREPKEIRGFSKVPPEQHPSF
jgi:hypothetical protein